MKKFLFFNGVFLLFFQTCFAVTITEGTYNGIDHFIIYTKNVTYYYDKEGGAFSRIVDKNGNDWINHSQYPWQIYPESSASSFRGLPNLVGENPGEVGIGYPGFKNCISEKLNRKVIQTTSLDGSWSWRWVFHKKYAELFIDKIDEKQSYKFMYNGLIGGRFNPQNQYYGTNLGGPFFEIYNFNKGEKLYGNWSWMYLGDRDVKRIIFFAKQTPDHDLDSYSFMSDSNSENISDNGMVTFGFGVKDEFTPLLKEAETRFIIGIIEKRVEKPKDHLKIKRIIEGLMK